MYLGSRQDLENDVNELDTLIRAVKETVKWIEKWGRIGYRFVKELREDLPAMEKPIRRIVVQIPGILQKIDVVSEEAIKLNRQWQDAMYDGVLSYREATDIIDSVKDFWTLTENLEKGFNQQLGAIYTDLKELREKMTLFVERLEGDNENERLAPEC